MKMVFWSVCVWVCVRPNPINCLVNVVYWYDNTRHSFYSIIFPFLQFLSPHCLRVSVCMALLFSDAAPVLFSESVCCLVCFIFEIAHCLFIKLWNKFSRASDFPKYMMMIRDVCERANCLQHQIWRHYTLRTFYFWSNTVHRDRNRDSVEHRFVPIICGGSFSEVKSSL